MVDDPLTPSERAELERYRGKERAELGSVFLLCDPAAASICLILYKKINRLQQRNFE